MSRRGPGSSEPVLSDGSLEPPGGDAPPLPTGPERYERRQLVGVGGMGRVSVVYDRALGREVALKEPAPGHGAALVEEARRAAALEHPGIVPVLDAGIGADGVPWYTMRLLRGRPLEVALNAEADLAGRLGWLRAALAACEAVAYAHARGVVHRDLTPSNLLLGELGETYVADWGLAAAHGARGGGGTPGYRAPEQAAGAPADARADVYALGAVLFRLCAGGPPGAGAALPAETPPELAAIVGRATAPRPEDRYPDARALAEDLAAFLDGRRVAAHAYSRRELVRRFVAAWRAPLAVAAAATVVLVVTATAQYLATVRERDRALAAEHAASAHLGLAIAAHAVEALRAGSVADAAVLAAHAAARTGAPDPTDADPTGPAEPAARGRAYALGVLAGVAAGASPVARPPVTLPAGCDDARLRGDTLFCFGPDRLDAWALDGTTARGTWPGPSADAAFHDGRLVHLDADGVVTFEGRRVPPIPYLVPDRLLLGGGVVAAAAGAVVAALDLATDAWVSVPTPCPAASRMLAVVPGPDGRLVVACSSGAVFAGPVGALREVGARLPDPSAIAWLGDDLLVGTVRGEVVRVSLEGTERWRTPVAAAAVQDLGPLGADAVWVRGPRGTSLLDADAGGLRTVLPAFPSAPTTGADGALYALVSGALRAWDLPAAWPATRVSTPSGLSALAVSPDGRSVVLGGGASRVARWDLATGDVAPYAIPDGVVKALAWSPDGRRILASVSGANATFGLEPRDTPPLPADMRGLWRRLAFLPSGALVGLAYVGGPVVWDAAGAPVAIPTVASGLHDLGVGPGGAALLGSDGGVWWLADPPTAVTRRATLPDARAVDAGPDGHIAVSAGDAVVILDPTGAELRRWSVGGRAVVDLAWAPGGAWIATANIDGTADLWDADAGVLVATLAAHADRVSAVEFAPDAAWLVTVSWDHTARRWSLAPLRTPPDPAAVEAQWGVTLEETRAAARW